MTSRHIKQPGNVIHLERDSETNGRIARLKAEEIAREFREHAKKGYAASAARKLKEGIAKGKPTVEEPLSIGEAKTLATDTLCELIKHLSEADALRLARELEEKVGMTASEIREATFVSVASLLESSGASSTNRLYHASAAWRGLGFNLENIRPQERKRIESAVLGLVDKFIEADQIHKAFMVKRDFPGHMAGLKPLLYKHLDRFRQMGNEFGRRSELLILNSFEIPKEEYAMHIQKGQRSLPLSSKT